MGKVFAATLIVIALASAMPIILHTWEPPADISTHGRLIDEQMSETMAEAGVAFLAAQLILAWLVWRFSNRPKNEKIQHFPGGARGLVAAAVIVVGIEVMALGIFGAKAWAAIYFTPPSANALPIQAQAGQFAFYFRYPGADGKFGPIHPEMVNEGNLNFFGLDTTHDADSKDDIVTAELAVPVNLQGCGPFVFYTRAAYSAGFRTGAGSRGTLHRDQAGQVRDLVHAALRSGSLQHEGISQSHVAIGLRQLVEAEGSLAVAHSAAPLSL
jgi:heme/copper-type cytochrome/quinol oxidase subunit 2